MDELLTPVSTRYTRSRGDGEPLSSGTRPASKAQVSSKISSTNDALQVLKSQPDYDALIAALQHLVAPASQIHVPTPQSASIVHVLVTELTPNYWPLLRQGSGDVAAQLASSPPPHAELLLSCLRSVSGLNAIIAHIKALVRESGLGSPEATAKRPEIPLNLEIFLDVLDTLLAGDASIRSLWACSAAKLPSAALKRAQAQQLAALLANGRIPSTAAEASAVAGTASSWVADGAGYSRWIGRNLSTWAKAQMSDDENTFCFDVLSRALSLGYPAILVRTIIDELLLSRDGSSAAFNQLCFSQPRASKKIIGVLLEYLAQRFLDSLDGVDSRTTVAAVAGVIDAAVGDDAARKNHLIDWCTAASGAGLGNGVGIRRAVVAVLAKDKEAILTVLEKSLAQFGDQLYIKHAAMLQQEVHTQVLLLSAGYIARLAPIKLTMLLKRGTYMNAISNRIAATQTRARLLGMVIGEALSAAVDSPTKKLDFHMEETETAEAEWLKGLVKVIDQVGPFDSIISAPASSPPALAPAPAPAKPKPKAKQRPRPAASVPMAIIEEVDSSDAEEELAAYAKGSDPEDSDDDATLVQRNKPRAPVYIRDLIAYLRDSESYDRQKLALQAAPVLIRRKANFGSEVSAHAAELAGLLVGLQDKFDMDEFTERRQQGMMALVVAQPESMAPWFARTFFEGDYSLAQRTTVLVTLGLSARELAGYETSEYQSASSFPSKRLPEKMEQLYLESSQKTQSSSSSSRLKALPPTALENVTKSLTASFLGPLAAEAADATSGPDVLKLQTFTERYKSRQKSRPRARAIPNTTAALLATYFFSPLTAHFQLALRSSKPAVFNPGLLSLYLQTLAIIVNAAGPSTLSLPQLTSELADLLLRIRTRVLGDLAATKGWLVAMTVLIEVNEGDMRRLCEEQGREVVETREWVGGIFERTRGDDGGEENEVKMLAAGVLIKLGEAIEKYQALLLGDLILS